MSGQTALVPTPAVRPSGHDVVVRAIDVVKDFVRGKETVHALRGVSLDIHRGEYLAIMGPPAPARARSST